MKTKQLTREELAAKKVGAIINLIITLGSAAFCVTGIILFAIRNHVFNFWDNDHATPQDQVKPPE